jgi:putative oxidoreductase
MEQARRKHLAIVIIRVFLAATMVVHGVARIYAGGVAPLGEFLSAQGFPLGLYLAWAITAFEIAGGIVLATGYYVPLLASIFAIELIVGIVLVHAKDGWFVVGLGRNGMEYSVLLIVSFLAIGFAHFGADESRRRRRR